MNQLINQLDLTVNKSLNQRVENKIAGNEGNSKSNEEVN
jgi:hypothetical protein